jgi:dTDP-4-dehydrorhamnose reductase
VRKNLLAGKAIRVVNDQWRTPTLAEDLALGCLLMAGNKSQGIYHISGEEYTNPYQIALETARFFGLNESLISATNASEFKEVGKRPPKTGFNIAKAKIELGFKPRSLTEGLQLVKSQLDLLETKG